MTSGVSIQDDKGKIIRSGADNVVRIIMNRNETHRLNLDLTQWRAAESNTGLAVGAIVKASIIEANTAGTAVKADADEQLFKVLKTADHTEYTDGILTDNGSFVSGADTKYGVTLFIDSDLFTDWDDPKPNRPRYGFYSVLYTDPGDFAISREILRGVLELRFGVA